MTPPELPNRVCSDCPVATSQMKAVLSPLPVASIFPPGLKATDCISELCPDSTWSSLLVAASYSRAVLSWLQPGAEAFGIWYVWDAELPDRPGFGFRVSK
ncbi:MAG TPA: hypothetical protein VMS73_06100 [Anaerolineaceae bacterium]|nr:hypothetical protein [Anaerolineaceae bacterium]